ncbi:putative plant snare 12 [Actinidia rufa]|uniref:Putative plant snare 12 n=1 Tax=Actinidia rufa TaxID=165716 RepID=A0A7J0GEA6_9ERIC|nr:putative plant snare 12 [Actinidia rufa]
MSNQELVNAGMKTVDETDQAIERLSKWVKLLMSLIQFSSLSRKLPSLSRRFGRQVATDKCIMLFLFLIVCGVIAIIIVKIVNPNNKSIRDIPGSAPPAPPQQEDCCI